MGMYDFPPILPDEMPSQQIAERVHAGLIESVGRAERISLMDRLRLRAMMRGSREDRELAIVLATEAARERGIEIPSTQSGSGWLALLMFFMEHVLPILLELLNNRRQR